MLSLASLLTVFASCSDAAVETESETIDREVPYAVDETEPPKYELPNQNWNGADYMQLYVGPYGAGMFTLEENGEILNDVRFRMETKIEDSFNIKMSEYSVDNTEERQIVSNLVSSGDTMYDTFITRDTELIAFQTAGNLLPLNDLENIDIDAEYWGGEDQAAPYTILDTNYMLVPISNVKNISDGACIYMNQQLAENYGLEVPYDDVFAGTWTLDKLQAFKGKGGRDINGDGVMSTTDDAFTFVIEDPCAVWRQMWTCFDIDIVTMDEEGYPQVMIYNDERFYNTLSATYDLFYTGLDAGFPFLDGDFAPIYDGTDFASFTENRALFFVGILKNMERSDFREMESDYAILPFPKYDELQDKYYSHLMMTIGFTMLTTTEDPEFSAAVIDAISCVTYYDIIPTYIETVLKDKLSRDRETKDSIQICIEGLRVDVGSNLLVDYFRYPVYSNVHKRGADAMATYFPKAKKVIDIKLGQIIEEIEKAQ